MAGKRHEEPQDLSSLKRPALQKLCKQYGLKANGKNTEMVRLLEEYRATQSLNATSDENTSSEQQEPTSVSQSQEEEGVGSFGEERESGDNVTGCEVGRCEGGRGDSEGEVTVSQEEEVTESEGGRKRGRGKAGGRLRGRRGRRRGKTLAVSSRGEDEKLDPTMSCDDQHSPAAVSHTANCSREDEKENLVSYSDLQEGKMKCANNPRRAVEGDNLKTGSTQEPSNALPVHQEQLTDIRSVSPSVSTHLLDGGVGLCGGESLTNTEQLCEMAAETEDVPMETTSEDVTMETMSDRRRTYSVSPRATSADENAPPLSPPLSPETFNTPTSSSRKRRRTHSISPASSLLLSGTVLPVDTAAGVSGLTTEGTDGGEVEDVLGSDQMMSATDEMLALLDKRFADRKADPSYVSPPSSYPTKCGVAGSRIPVSKALAKINQAHEKQFNKMPSILEFSERRKKRALALQKVSTPAPPAKRQKVAPKTPAMPSASSSKKSTLTKSKFPPSSQKKPSVVPNSTTSKPKLTTVARFEPNVRPKYDFGGTTTSAVTKTPKSAAKSDLQPFTFSSQPKGSSGALAKFQPMMNKSQFRSHKGKLPEFKYSIY